MMYTRRALRQLVSRNDLSAWIIRVTYAVDVIPGIKIKQTTDCYVTLSYCVQVPRKNKWLETVALHKIKDRHLACSTQSSTRRRQHNASARTAALLLDQPIDKFTAINPMTKINTHTTVTRRDKLGSKADNGLLRSRSALSGATYVKH